MQSCVVTLEPVPAHIDEEIAATFLPEESKLGREGFGQGGEILIDVDGPDSPETFSGDRIDVGALAEEYFGLAIDPYPRKKGVALDPTKGAVVVDVADVGVDALLVHDERRDDPGIAFALSRLSPEPTEPTPMGVFRAVERPVYGSGNPVNEAPPGREALVGLLHSGTTWTVD